jgi:hypothetical protein
MKKAKNQKRLELADKFLNVQNLIPEIKVLF